MAAVSRPEIEAILGQHNEASFIDLSGGDLTSDWLRAFADAFRGPMQSTPLADDLDALADRYETETR
jgi:hypothetical protein